MVCASFLGAAALAISLPSSALAINEFQRITGSDLSPNDNFGYSVGMSGNTAIIGSWKDDRPGMMLPDDTGSAYIFRSGVTAEWTQLDKLTPSDPAQGDAFGSAVAIDGNTAVIGALSKGASGGAYIFRDNGSGDWLQVDSLAGNDATMDAQFGHSVAISGNTAIVGAWENDMARGAAYVFRDNGAGDWMQIAKLTANDAMAGDRFGVSVAIEGNTAMVGAHFDSNDAGAAVGAVYVFEETGGTWTQIDKLIASDAHLSNRFGTSVALEGNTAVIGAAGDPSTSGELNTGAVYIYRRDASMEWQEVQKLVASDAAGGDLFGASVAINEGNAIVGAFEDSNGGPAVGSAYFFKQNALGSWHQAAKLTASDRASGNALGFSVAIAGGIGLAGAPLSGTGDAGAAYLYNVPVGIAGDFNQDGLVDAADFVVWRDSVGQTGTSLPADGNGDGTVNQADHALWRANFGLGVPVVPTPLQSSAVPEPTTIVSLLVAWLAALAARATKRPLAG
jgi:hypothetical protein